MKLEKIVFCGIVGFSLGYLLTDIAFKINANPPAMETVKPAVQEPVCIKHHLEHSGEFGEYSEGGVKYRYRKTKTVCDEFSVSAHELPEK